MRGYNPVEILPLRALTPAAQYAALAAIHDAVCDDVEQIDPWSAPGDAFEPLKAGTAYAVLVDRVSRLADEDQARVERALENVQVDLARMLPAPPTPADAPPLAATPGCGGPAPVTGREKAGATGGGNEKKVNEYLDAKQADLDVMVSAYETGDTNLGKRIYDDDFSSSVIGKAIGVNRGAVHRTKAYSERVAKHRTQFIRSDGDIIAEVTRRARE